MLAIKKGPVAKADRLYVMVHHHHEVAHEKQSDNQKWTKVCGRPCSAAHSRCTKKEITQVEYRLSPALYPHTIVSCDCDI